jgi:hypothetical protein
VVQNSIDRKRRNGVGTEIPGLYGKLFLTFLDLVLLQEYYFGIQEGRLKQGSSTYFDFSS